jgi:Laminin G domain
MRNRAGRRVGALGALVAGLLLVGSVPASASVTTLAYWKMNEPRGARRMHDSTPHHVDGEIGSHVVTGYRYGGATGYHWRYRDPNAPPADRRRLVKVSDSRLNPLSRLFAVTIRFRTTRRFGNIIQKGQAGAPGGYFKFQIPRGKLTCLFRGVVDGRLHGKAVNSGTRPLDDGRWHTVTCKRTHKGLVMRIDHKRTRRAIGWTGRIENSVPLTIGGKYNCDQMKITCDYFTGSVDFVKIRVGHR